MTQNVDTVIHAKWIIPVSDSSPGNAVYENHAIVIHNGRILAILPSQSADKKYNPAETLKLDEQALIPGLINSHTHAAMSLFRGLADDLPLMQWLQEYIWPAETQWVSEEFVTDGSRLAIAEMLKGGITCFNDMYFYPDVTAHVAAKAHIRASLGMIVIDFPTNWAENIDEYFDKGLQLHDQYRTHPLIDTQFAPHAPYSVSDEPLKRIQKLAHELETAIHMHVHETKDEVQMGIEQHKMRPIKRLKQLNMLSPSLMAVHMTQLNEEEIQLFSDNGCHVVHCPQSNLKLASGFCPVNELLKAGVNICIGTDGAASNNSLDMFQEMKMTALLGKGIAKDSTAIPADEVLKMATINGARALGIDHETGSLDIGKAGDITAVDLGNLRNQPVYDPVSQIVYSANSNNVSHVWVAGKQVVKQRQLTTMDEQDILKKARTWQDKITNMDKP